MSVFDDELKQLNRKANTFVMKAMECIEEGDHEGSKRNLIEAGVHDLKTARKLDKRGFKELSVEYYISAGSSYYQAGLNDKAVSIFRSALELGRNLPDDLVEELTIYLDKAIARSNFGMLTLMDKKNIEAIMGALLAKFGYISGRGAIMKIYHQISRTAGRFGIPLLLTKGMISYSPIFYSEINDYVKYRESEKLLVRDSKNRLLPSSSYQTYLLAEYGSFMTKIEKTNPVLSMEVNMIFEKYGMFRVKEWEDHEEIKLGISRKKQFKKRIV